MHSENLKYMAKEAKASNQPLGRIAHAAIEHKTLKLAAAIEEGLAAGGYKVTTNPARHDRTVVQVFDATGELVAQANSVTRELAIEHAMLGAIREGR